MPDFYHKDDQFLILNRIDNSIPPLSNAVFLLTRELLTLCWTWFVSKLFDASNDALAVPL